MASGFRTVPRCLKVKLFTGKAQAGGDGRTRASGELLLSVRKGLAPPESLTSDVAEAEPAFAVGH